MKDKTFCMEQLLSRYSMKAHEENGSYLECDYPYSGKGRAPSGSCYYFVPAGECTLFHRIDCDEYWCFHVGSCLDIWIIDRDGKLERKKFGLDEDANPIVYFEKGVVFGSRNTDKDGDGTFFSCVTVPRFSYDGFEILSKTEVIKICPEVESFFK